MAALTADRNTETRGAVLRDYEIPAVAADILYGGAAATLKAGTGYAQPAQAASGERFIGIVQLKCDNAAGAAGAKKVKIIKPASGCWDGSGLVQADCGSMLYFSDDHTVTKTAGNVKAGMLEEFISGSKVWVDHLPAYGAA